MCGIFAYIGQTGVLEFLLKGLRRLEYRGYDSAGVAVHDGVNIEVCKKPGKVENLTNSCRDITLKGTVGIAHTRWATHGRPTEINSHPHYTADRGVCVVHNGIIENYIELKKELIAKGYHFQTETDTELLVHLVDNVRKELGIDTPWIGVVAYSLRFIIGAYGAVFLFKDSPDLIIGAKNGSPLILGIKKVNKIPIESTIENSVDTEGNSYRNDDEFVMVSDFVVNSNSNHYPSVDVDPNSQLEEFILSSDVSAIIEHTRDVVYLDDGEIIEVSKSCGGLPGGFLIKNINHLASLVSRKFKSVVPLTIEQEIPKQCEVHKHKHTCALNCRSFDSGGDLYHDTVHLTLTLDELEKSGYEHFMLKEIMDQPNTITNTLRGRLHRVRSSTTMKENNDGNFEYRIVLGGLDTVVKRTVDNRNNHNIVCTKSDNKSVEMSIDEPIITNNGIVVNKRTAIECLARAPRIIICGCGTSWHSALIAEWLIESYARINVEVEYSSEFRYRPQLLSSDDVLIAISQSGETMDTLEAVKLAKSNGVVTIGIVNVVGSSITRHTDAGIYLHAGPEIGVASTKAFTSQVVVLTMLALRLAQVKGVIENDKFNSICEKLFELPDIIRDVLTRCSQIDKISRYFKLASNFLFLGRGYHFPVALEGALKLKEISYIHAEGYPAAELKHGPIALIGEFMPVVVIATVKDPAYQKIWANIEEIRSRCGELIIITDTEEDAFLKVTDADLIIRVPEVDISLQPILTVIPLQLLSYYIAKRRGCSIDQPRNLAKSVTV